MPEIKRLVKAYSELHTDHLRLKGALSTLDSEKACNAILTDELEVMREQLDHYEKLYGIL